MAPFDVGLLAADLQEMAEQLSQDTNFAHVMAGSAVGISGALTVGYVLWTIRWKPCLNSRLTKRVQSRIKGYKLRPKPLT